MYQFAKTSKGYAHVRANKCCQDYSMSYSDKERRIITACDGHGGNIYVRSDLGSKFASDAVLNVLKTVTPYSLRGEVSEEYLAKIRLSILCEWNRQVEQDLARNPLHKWELDVLSHEEQVKLKKHPERAYGTTMIGALLLGNKLLVVHLGDGESLLIRKGQIEQVFQDDEDEPVANVTYSMCAEDAFSHIKARVVDFNDYDGLLLCTDGVVNPYQNYPNFLNSMIKPLVFELLMTKSMSAVANYVSNLGLELGIGDDVSLSFFIKEGIPLRYYH